MIIFKENLSFQIKEEQVLIRMGPVMVTTNILVAQNLKKCVQMKILVIFLH